MPALRIRAEVDSQHILRKLDDFRIEQVPDNRARLTQGVMREVLRRTISRHPVDTGRSRAAWSAALEQLGGTPPPGRPGRSPDAIAEGAKSFDVSKTETKTTSQLAVTNGVDYVPFLEFGTRSQAPHHMARRSLSEVQQIVRQLAAMNEAE